LRVRNMIEVRLLYKERAPLALALDNTAALGAPV
jgi:hypothetical protein